MYQLVDVLRKTELFWRRYQSYNQMAESGKLYTLVARVIIYIHNVLQYPILIRIPM